MKHIRKLALAAVILTATSAHSTETVRVMHSTPVSLYKALAERFMKDNPDIKVELDPVAASYEEITQRALRSSVADDLPDVIFQGLNRTQVLIEREIAVPLDSTIKSDPDWPSWGYQPDLIKIGQSEGKTYALPFGISTPVVYFNPELVKRAGGDPSNFPKNWAGITDLATKITSLEAGMMGVWFNYGDTSGNWTYISLVESQGGRMMLGDDRTISFDGVEGLKALEILKEIGQAGMLDISRDQARQAFAGGKIGIYVSSSGEANFVAKAIDQRFPLHIANFPVTSKVGRLPAGGNSVMLTAKDVERRAAAWKFIKFAVGPIGQTVSAGEAGYVPVNTVAVSTPDLLGRFYEEHPYQKTAFSQMSISGSWYSFPGPNSAKITDVIKSHLQTVVSLKREPNDVLQSMKQDVQALLPK